MPVRVAVLGASGRIGRLVAARLASVPDVELTLSSRHRPPAHAPEGGRWVRCDLTDTARLVEVLTGQDVVVAAVDGDLDAISGSLVAAMTGAGVRRLLWVTGLGIHHEITGPTGRMFARLADAGWDVTVYGRPGSTRPDDPTRDPRIVSRLTRGLETKSASTEKKPMTVARPTSVRLAACLE